MNLSFLRPYKFSFGDVSRDAETSMAAKETSSSPPRLRDRVGSWIANEWVPPRGWRYFSAEELRQVYQNKSMLWIGDSTARRAATTLYAILNATDDISIKDVDAPGVIDVNKSSKGKQEPCHLWMNQTNQPVLCRPIPGGSQRGKNEGSFLLVGIPCLSQIETFLQAEVSGESNITQGIDIIVIAMGIWEQLKSLFCKKGTNETRPERQAHVMSLLSKLQEPGRTIIWRTSGFDGRRGNDSDVILEMNEHAMDLLDELTVNQHTRIQGQNKEAAGGLTYVNWGGAVYPRSFGTKRISGDILPHYGFEARYVLIQMITNVLAEKLHWNI